MRIGIAYKAQYTIFGSGHGQSVLALAEWHALHGNEVVLVNAGQFDWWEDAKGLDTLYPRGRIGDAFDVLVDVGGLLEGAQRSGTKNVLLLRSDPSFTQLEAASYVSNKATPCLDKLDEVWVWDAMVPEGRLPLISTLFKGLPIKRIPYVWTSSILKNYLRLENIVDEPTENVRALHIAEKNTSNTSSCVVPFVAANNYLHPIRLFNATHLETDPFFQDNIATTSFKSSKITYEDRERYADWLGTEVIVLTHGRFLPFRPGLLDLVWLGIPFVHNCEMLRDAGLGLETVYYPDNDVGNVLDRFLLTQWNAQRAERRAWVEQRFAAYRDLRVGFVDMWDGFGETDNFFVELMQQFVEPGTRVVGRKDAEGCDLVICGPFGNTVMDGKAPVVYFSGEREDVRGDDPGIALFLTHRMEEDATHMRFPLWLLFLNWFGQDSKPLRNPNGLSVEYALKPYECLRANFCAFLVSNPMCKERNEAFEVLNRHCRVNSGGAYKNNIGGPVPCHYGGGGGGDAAKFDFFKSHMFALCYENSVAPGYVTEKLLHAKMAGCVPLYRGAEEAVKDFDPAGFVHVKDGQDVVALVKELQADAMRLRAMSQVPALSPSRYLRAKGLVNRVGRKLVELATKKGPQVTIEAPVFDPTKPAGSPLFLTFATANFLTSTNLLLNSIQALRAKEPTIRARVYLGADVGTNPLAAKYPWVEFCRLPATSPVPDFPDFFQPDQFGWKLWMLRETARDPDLDGDLVLYTDAGATWISLPTEMLQIADQRGVCLVRDRNQLNRTWCSADMVKAMSVTEEELDQFQCQAAAIAFKAGSEAAGALLEEAYTWGSRRDCLFGPKWAAPGSGHRHDQSILSILATRQHTHLVEGARLSSGASLRKAYQRSTPMYHHRGNPIVHAPVLPGIDDIWVISLDRRPDRYASWTKEYPDLVGTANRFPAIDGKVLTLNDNLRRLFAKNDFKWKKSVTGCALSHILLWAQLASEHPAVDRYLILEDDHRWTSKEAWRDTWAAAAASAPADAELLLLGGVLPGNRAAYQDLFRPVNDVWGTIEPNNLFTGGQGPPVPFFHFCAYSYVLTRAGAKKLLASLEANGCYTSIDNFLCHPKQGLKKYSMKTLMAGCFQDEDPAYQKAQFDEFLRVDSYDSDIWNNKECFDDVSVTGIHQRIWPCLMDVISTQPHSIQTQNTLREQAVSPPTETIVYYYGQVKTDAVMEETWLKELCPSITYQSFPAIDKVVPNAFLLVTRPHLDEWRQTAKALESKGIPFRVLHLSDEDCSDPVDFYAYSCCKKVIRNYIREGLGEKVTTIPLGFGIGKAGIIQPFSKRPLVWSFHGSNQTLREPLLAPFKTFEPNSCRFIPSFRHPTMTKADDYRALLETSQYVPILKGQHFETFRLYEALEFGAIPLYVRTEGDDVYWRWLRKNVPLVELKDWTLAAKLVTTLGAALSKAEQYRTGLYQSWKDWEDRCREAFQPGN